MTMQYDVKQAHLDVQGFFLKFPTRIKGISFVGTNSAGSFVLFDTLTDPVSSGVTYGRSGTTITVSKTAHGLNTGDTIGIHFNNGTGGTATDGNYTVTKLTDNTFTITDINSGSITGTPAAVYSTRWLATYQSAASDTYTNIIPIPGEGIRVNQGIFGYMDAIASGYIFYG